jgi:hypothetical protein
LYKQNIPNVGYLNGGSLSPLTQASAITYTWTAPTNPSTGAIDLGSCIYWNYGIDHDVYPPSGDIKINYIGAPWELAYTNSASVILSLFYRDAGSGVAYMHFRNSPDEPWSPWYERTGTVYFCTFDWTLPTGDGTKYVYVEFMDEKGLISPTYFDSVILDTQPPSGSITIETGHTYCMRRVSLYLAYSDTLSGVWRVRYSNDGIWDTEPWEKPLSVRNDWELQYGDGIKTVYYQVEDNAGGLSPTYSDTIILDTVGPITTISHSPGSSTFSLSATDSASPVVLIVYSVDFDWLRPYHTPITLTGSGSHRIDYYSRDEAGNDGAGGTLIVHYLTVDTDSAEIATISGTGWYDENTIATTGTAPDTIISGGITFAFSTCMLDGIPVAGNPANILMDDYHIAVMSYMQVAQDRHDIAVVNITTSAPYAYPGRMVDITVVVRNNGNVSETFDVTVFRNSTPIETLPVPNLDPEENATLVFHWNTSGLTPCNTWIIKAEAPLVGDINPSDNTFTDGTVKIALLGDVNADGKINLDDLIKAAKAFGAIPCSPIWDPQADISPDGVINITDFVKIAQRFGQHY